MAKIKKQLMIPEQQYLLLKEIVSTNNERRLQAKDTLIPVKVEQEVIQYCITSLHYMARALERLLIEK